MSELFKDPYIDDVKLDNQIPVWKFCKSYKAKMKYIILKILGKL